MNCTHVEKLLALHVGNDLNDEQAVAVAAHLATCDDCRTLAAEYRASQALLRLHTPPEFDGAFFDDIRRAVRHEIDRNAAPSVFARFADFARFAGFARSVDFARRAGQTSPRRMALAASFALLLLVFGASALRSFNDRTDFETASQLPANDDATPPANKSNSVRQTSAQSERTPEIATPLNSNAPTPRRGDNSTPRIALTSRNRGASHTARGRNGRTASPEKFVAAPDFESESGVAAQSSAEVQQLNATEIARSDADATPEMLRIELQTSDPNIRIIWLSPTAADAASTKQKLDIR